MLKKIISWMLPFFIYNLIVLLLILLMFLLPIGSDIVLLIGWGLYIPYIYFVIYILGFIFGYFIQARSLVQSIKLQLILAIISFTTMLLVLSTYIISEPSLFSTFAFVPAFGSSCLFFIGELFSRHKQNKS